MVLPKVAGAKTDTNHSHKCETLMKSRAWAEAPIHPHQVGLTKFVSSPPPPLRPWIFNVAAHATLELRDSGTIQSICAVLSLITAHFMIPQLSCSANSDIVPQPKYLTRESEDTQPRQEGSIQSSRNLLIARQSVSSNEDRWIKQSCAKNIPHITQHEDHQSITRNF